MDSSKLMVTKTTLFKPSQKTKQNDMEGACGKEVVINGSVGLGEGKDDSD